MATMVKTSGAHRRSIWLGLPSSALAFSSVLLALLLSSASAMAAPAQVTPASASVSLSATPAADASGSALPDERVEELVSTSGNAGEPYPPTSSESGFRTVSHRPYQAAADGEAMTYVGEPGVSGGTGEAGPGEGIQWLAKRTPEGWKTEVITPVNTVDGAYQAFSSDDSIGFIGATLNPPLAPEGLSSCRDLYSRSTTGDVYGALYTPLTPGECGSPLFAGASEDGSQVIFQSEAALTSNATPATEVPAGHSERHQDPSVLSNPCMFGCNLYESVDGRPRLVSVIEGKPVANATFGGYAGETDAALSNFSDAISADGSRIFWTDTQTGPDMEHVYVLENGASTVQVSGAGPAEYWAATRDGRYAYYTEAGELWRFDTTANVREPLAGKGAEVQGVIGVNQTGEDGAYLYFVAEGVLATNETAQNATAKAGRANLYLLHNGNTSFIATLAPNDDFLAAGGASTAGDWRPDVGQRTAEMTPDGKTLLFQSLEALTGYDNLEVANQPLAEVFAYDAADAQLACVSCKPDGEPPNVVESAQAAKVPVSEESTTYMRRWISEDGGRVFFDTKQALVPSDRNETQDVYEWEREGEGTCRPQTPPRLNHGCLSLLSGGESNKESILVDADLTGDNVFFEHLGPLGHVEAPVDHLELYDARVNGGFAESSLACVGTGCQSVPPAPPSFATPASATFAGAGNFAPAAPPVRVTKRLTRVQKLTAALKKCRTKPKAKRAACERQARRKYPSKAKPKTKRTQTKGSK
jgi:hypothetical protein